MATSFGCLAAGVALATLALGDPERAPRLERWSGLCVIAGLCLLGFALHAGHLVD
ncbi:hypothetical protein [Methylobacterium trifolii]|uniref:hypothetical protein n=1 Tax=Methylobacterium trifolii TaxID=1003092 RepID=UPI001EDE5F30|nr:hypothetical protein [Methylobacterium trifolii]